MKVVVRKSDFLKTSKGYLLTYFIFLLAGFAIYWSVLDDTLIGDDYFYTVRAGEYSLSELWRLFEMHPSFIRPLPSLVFWVQFKLFGVEAVPSHSINVAIHASSAFLLFWLLQKIGASIYVALFSGLLFIVTPVAAEPVTWSSGRFDLLSTFFILLAAGLYLIAVEKQNRLSYIGALAAAFFAMLSKESAMILVIIFPVIELLFGIFRDKNGLNKLDTRRDRLLAGGIRVAIFYVLFFAFIGLRYAILGRFGGYKGVPFLSIPEFMTTVRTAWTFLSPVSSRVVSENALKVIGGYFLLLIIVSQVLVLVRWRRVSSAVRKIWLFLAVFLFVTLIPVNTQLFNFGIYHHLRDSRELYIIAMLMITIMVVSLFEFGWKNRTWQTSVTIALLILVLPWIWGLQKNNTLWGRSAAISHKILEDTQDLLPEPPQNAKIYYLGVPEWDGAYVFITALKFAVMNMYGRQDLQVVQIKQGDTDFDINETFDGYLFVYDREEGRLVLVHRPD